MITEAQLLEEIRAAFADAGPDDAMTTKELADALDVPILKVRRILPELIREGKAEAVRVQRPRWDGISQKVPGVRLIT